MNGRLGGIIQKVNQPKFINKHSVWSISIKENGKWTSALTSKRKVRRCGLFLCWFAETAQCLESWMKSKRPYNPNLNNQREVSFHLVGLRTTNILNYANGLPGVLNPQFKRHSFYRCFPDWPSQEALWLSLPVIILKKSAKAEF